MLTALADVTQIEKYYEEAWILSNKRYARAKRTLARACYDRGDFHDCCQHMDEALAVQPLVPNAWYIKGIITISSNHHHHRHHHHHHHHHHYYYRYIMHET